jgi:hypothetical protein
MKRLLAAVGLAAVAGLTLVLAACTDVASGPEENPLLDRSDTVSGTVYRNGSPEGSAWVWIYYNDTSVLTDACKSPALTAGNGTYTIGYIIAARGHYGVAHAWKTIGETKWSGWSDLFYYPNNGGEVTGVDITLTEE